MAKAATDTDKINQLETRVKTLEDLKTKLEGAAMVVKAGWITLGITIFAIVSGAITFGWNYATNASTIAHHDKDIAEFKELHKTDMAELHKATRELADKYEVILKAHNNLRANVIVLYDRQPKGPPGGIEALVYRGRIEAVSPNAITILPPEIGEPALKFVLTPKIGVRLGGCLLYTSDAADE